LCTTNVPTVDQRLESNLTECNRQAVRDEEFELKLHTD